MIVDGSTGRVMSDRRWSLGLHEAVETKAGVPVGKESETKTLTTYQNFFTLYPKLSGMSGTVITSYNPAYSRSYKNSQKVSSKVCMLY